MNAERIVWQWCSRNISQPSRDLQNHLQTLAMGVIHAHRRGNMSPLENARTEEKTQENRFDPAGEAKGDGLGYKVVKDRLFDMTFEEMLVHVEIFHCWNSYNITETTGEEKEFDNGAHYLVCIGEIIPGPPLIITSEESEG